MTDAPKTIVSYRMDSGAVSASYIRTDAPELAALVEALREVMDGENWKLGRKFCGNSGNFSLQTQRAALAAWDALLADKP